MRFVLAMVLAGLVALPLTASAQEVEEGASPEPSAEEPAPSSEPAPEEPALQLKLDSAGVDVGPSPPRTVDGYTLEEMELRVKKAKIGLGGSTVVLVVGCIVVLAGNLQCMFGDWTERCNRIENAGAVVISIGGAGMIATGALLGVRKRKRRRLEEAHYGTPRRVQWDLAQSRLVF